MMNTTTRRWPKGTWMRLHSAELLRAFVGPEPGKKISQRTLARYAGVHPSFINHLTSGRRRSCEPKTAQRIVDAIGVPLSVLFVTETASASSTDDQHEGAAA